MNRIHLVFAVLLMTLVGCTDTIDTITREYRNATNEAIDALMMVTDNNTALQMTNRVFKPMVIRYKAIDDKLKIVQANRTKKELVKEVLESDGFQIYLNELEMNRQRASLEFARIRNVMKQYEREAREKLDAEGNFNKEPNLKEDCPGIYDLLINNRELDVLEQQLTQPKLLEIMTQFPQWKVDGYPAMFDKFRERRRTTFANPDEPRPKIID